MTFRSSCNMIGHRITTITILPIQRMNTSLVSLSSSSSSSSSSLQLLLLRPPRPQLLLRRVPKWHYSITTSPLLKKQQPQQRLSSSSSSSSSWLTSSFRFLSSTRVVQPRRSCSRSRSRSIGHGACVGRTTQQCRSTTTGMTQRRTVSSSSTSTSSSTGTTTTTSTTTTTPTTTVMNPYHTIGQWLLCVSSMVIAMISIGGITRLTQSGLSMTSWTLTGSIPPITHQQWVQEFEIYQQYPEYQQRRTMTLSEFQYIYFWEYGHRMMGRFIGIAYVLPYLYFTIRQQIPKMYHPRFVFIGSLGLLQGYIGWWMVQSGLSMDRKNDTHEIRVKPLRLATHLTMAITTYSLLLVTALEMFRYPMIHVVNSATAATTTTGSTAAIQPAMTLPNKMILTDLLRTLSRSSLGVMAFTIITIVSGALVAGNDAGRAYNTFPKMNDEYFPSNYFGDIDDGSTDDSGSTTITTTATNEPSSSSSLSPLLRNFYENTATVQFNHRMCGITTALSGISLSIYGLYRIYPKLLQQHPLSSHGYGISSSKVMPNATSVSVKALVPYLRHGLIAMGLAVSGQFTLGVTTLLWYVPISLAALHQLGSIVVLSSSIYVFHTARTMCKALSVPLVEKVISATTIATTPSVPPTTDTQIKHGTNTILTNPLLVRQLSTGTHHHHHHDATVNEKR